MQLRYLFILSLIALGFSACSREDTPVEVPVAQMDAYVSFAASSGAQTRAAAVVGLENQVSELTAFIFKADGTLAAVKQQEVAQSGESIDKIEHISLKIASKGGASSTEKFTAVLVANANEQVKNVTSLSALKDASLITPDLTNYNPVSKNEKALPMISKEIDFTGLKPLGEGPDNDNWISADQNSTKGTVSTDAKVGCIWLDRLVARVDLVNLKVDLSKYPGASFDLTKVFMANVRSTSPFLNDVNNAAFWKGFQSGYFEEKQGWVIVGKKSDGTPLAKGELTEGQNVKPGLAKDISVSYTDLSKADGNTFASPSLFYIFRNPYSEKPIEQTRLILEGMFKRSASDQGDLRHFHVVLKDTKTDDAVAEIRPNAVYELTVKISGEGSPNEDDVLTTAEVEVTITVNPWKTIEQEEDIEAK